MEKTYTEEKTVTICDICERQFYWYKHSDICEKCMQDKCNHSNNGLDTNIDWENENIRITLYCKDCKKSINNVNIDENYDVENLIKMIGIDKFFDKF